MRTVSPKWCRATRHDTGGEHWRVAGAREQDVVDEVVDVFVLREQVPEVMEEAEKVSRAGVQQRTVSIQIDRMVQEAQNYRDEDEANKSKIVTRYGCLESLKQVEMSRRDSKKLKYQNSEV